MLQVRTATVAVQGNVTHAAIVAARRPNSLQVKHACIILRQIPQRLLQWCGHKGHSEPKTVMTGPAGEAYEFAVSK